MLLGDNKDGGADMLPLIRFQFAGICIVAGLPCLYIRN